MFLKKFLIPLILTTCFLTACNNGGVTPKPVPEPERYPTIDWDDEDTISNGGVGGFLIEISIDRILTTGMSYECLFSSNHATDKSIIIESSVPGVATITRFEGDDKKFEINAKKYGDTILKIKDADKLLVYRYIVRVRDPKPLETIGEELFKIDKFVTDARYESWFGSWGMTIIDYNPVISGVLKGGDDYEQNVRIEFTLKYDSFIPERDCYNFIAETTSTTSATKIGSIQFTRYCDWVFVYGSDGYSITQLINTENFAK